MKKKRNPIPNIKDYSSLLNVWHRSSKVMHKGHHKAANYFQKIHRTLGITSTVFNAIVASSLFYALFSIKESDQILDNKSALILGGIFSVLAAILTGIFLFVKYDEISIQHLRSATNFQAVLRLVEQNKAHLSEGKFNAQSLDKIRHKWTKALENSIPLGETLYKRADNELDHT